MKAMQVPRSPTSAYFIPNFCHATTLFRLLLTAELIALILFLAFSGRETSSWQWSTFGLLSLFIQWITLSTATVLCVLRKRLMRLPVPLSSCLCLSVSVIIITTATLSTHYIDFLPSIQAMDSNLVASLLRNLAIGLIITGFILRYTYVQNQLVRQQQVELQTRLASLQSRIQPHFLFNSLNNIVSLIPTRPKLAETLTEDLAILLRASLSENAYKVPLKQEIDLAKRYLHMEKQRLGERLTIQWQIPETLSNKPVPHLLLQPLLENAIKHGIQPSSDNGLVSIHITQQTKHLIIHITNTLPVFSDNNQQGCHIGITNVRERLKVLYGDQGSLDIKVTSKHYQTLLKVPVE